MTTILILLGLAFAFLVGLQVFVHARARKAQGKPVKGIPGEIGNAVATGGRVLAYFHSPACGRCRAQTPIMQKLRSEFPGVFVVNVAEGSPAIRMLGVMATPTTVLIEEGTIREFFVGAAEERTLRRFLEGNPPRVGDVR